MATPPELPDQTSEDVAKAEAAASIGAVDITEYLGGRCHIFASALSAVTGWPMEFVWDVAPFDDDDPPEALIHAWCVRPDGKCFDAAGETSMQKLETSEYGDYGEAESRNTTQTELSVMMRDGVLDKSRDGEINSLKSIINANKAKYGITTSTSAALLEAAAHAIEADAVSKSELHTIAERLLGELFSDFKCEFDGKPIPVPAFKVVNQVRSAFLGRCIYRIWKRPDGTRIRPPEVGHNSLIEIQKSIMDSPETVERVICHELVHHVINMSEPIDSPEITGHGSLFFKIAAQVNAVKGADYVAENSDSTYTVVNKKPINVLICKNADNTNYGYQFAVRMSQEQRRFVSVLTTRTDDAVLVQTTDTKYLNGAPIKFRGPWAIPQSHARQEELRLLFESKKQEQPRFGDLPAAPGATADAAEPSAIVFDNGGRWVPPVISDIERAGAWPRILARLRVDEESLNVAGSGGHGVVFVIPEIDRALKVTDDKVEAQAALALKKDPMDEAYHVYDVFQVADTKIYCIFCEMLEPPDAFFASEFEAFGTFFGTVTRDDVTSYTRMIEEMSETLSDEEIVNYEAFLTFMHNLAANLEDRGIIFTDIQQGNIMKRPDGQHVLIDIGHKSHVPYSKIETAKLLEALASRITAGPAVNAGTDEIAALRAFINVDDAEKGRQLAWWGKEEFADWAEAKGKSEWAARVRDDDMDFLDEVPPDVLKKWYQSKECLRVAEMVVREADAHMPSFLMMEYRSSFDDNKWLVHYSDHADDIVANGFQYGIDDPSMLALTTYFTAEKRKKRPGYAFAFLAEQASRSGGQRKYGKYALIFRAKTGGVVCYHVGDEEYQAIFWGPDSFDRHYVIQEGHNWILPDEDGDIVFKGTMDALIAHLDARGESP